MSNPSNYSPFNKSYKFICLQNQAYHQKNKKNMSPVVKTNIKLTFSRKSTNPQSPSQRRSQSSQGFQSKHNISDYVKNSNIQNSIMFRSNSCTNSVLLDKQKRIVHKNQSFQKFRSKRISRENIEMVARLLKASCQVIKKNQTERSFNNHLRYRQIRKKYNEHGAKKECMHLGNSLLLCPTLSQYHQSGLAQKFIQEDLSMSMSISKKPSTTQSLRKRRSNYGDQNNILNLQ